MTRVEEFNALLQELEATPERLSDTVTRGKARVRRQKMHRRIEMALIPVAAACFAFVLLVNFSVPFAMACEKVPFFKELAQAVSFHPSLHAAAENEWVQPIGQSGTDNGYTMTVEYLIVDQKQLNVFFKIKSEHEVDIEDHYILYPEFSDGQGEKLKASVGFSDCRINEELYYVTLDFTEEGNVPGEISMECSLQWRWDDSERKDRDEVVGKFAFDLSFDPKFTAQAEVVELNRWLELGEQQILLKNVEIYPTHMRLNLEDHPENTAWLRGLELYAQDNRGNCFDSVKNGIYATGSPDTPFTRTVRIESNYFAESKHLSLYITQAKWLEKDKQWTQLDLNTMETGFLPEGTEFSWWRKEGDDLTLSFRTDHALMEKHRFDMFLSWRAPDGTEGYIREQGVSGALDEPGSWDTYIKVENYPWDTIELKLNISNVEAYDKPVKIELF